MRATPTLDANANAEIQIRCSLYLPRNAPPLIESQARRVDSRRLNPREIHGKAAQKRGGINGKRGETQGSERLAGQAKRPGRGNQADVLDHDAFRVLDPNRHHRAAILSRREGEGDSPWARRRRNPERLDTIHRERHLGLNAFGPPALDPEVHGRGLRAIHPRETEGRPIIGPVENRAHWRKLRIAYSACFENPGRGANHRSPPIGEAKPSFPMVWLNATSARGPDPAATTPRASFSQRPDIKALSR